jgi:hypothetical protein
MTATAKNIKRSLKPLEKNGYNPITASDEILATFEKVLHVG